MEKCIIDHYDWKTLNEIYEKKQHDQKGTFEKGELASFFNVRRPIPVQIEAVDKSLEQKYIKEWSSAIFRIYIENMKNNLSIGRNNF